LSVVSDYRFEGLSSSDRHEAVWGSFYLWRPDKLFAGVFLSGTDNGASFEIDLYGGRRFDFGKTRLTAQGMVTFFPDKEDNGVPTYDFQQLSVTLQHPFGAVTPIASVAWSPEGSAGAGQVWRFSAGGEWRTTGWLTFSAKAGFRDSELRQDRSFWDVGATAYWSDFSFDLRYVGTDLSRQECFFTDWCEPGVVSKLTWHIPNGFARR
jgi:uncharacterized protein (TIGR02001 family)